MFGRHGGQVWFRTLTLSTGPRRYYSSENDVPSAFCDTPDGLLFFWFAFASIFSHSLTRDGQHSSVTAALGEKPLNNRTQEKRFPLILQGQGEGGNSQDLSSYSRRRRRTKTIHRSPHSLSSEQKTRCCPSCEVIDASRDQPHAEETAAQQQQRAGLRVRLLRLLHPAGPELPAGEPARGGRLVCATEMDRNVN